MNLPARILRLLKMEKFCTLATSHDNVPHAFLMVFTYSSSENLLIMSSKFNSNKVKQLKKNPAVALLLYNTIKSSDPPISCTFFGTASVLPPSASDYYKKIHYKHHPDKTAFIKGAEISIITVKLEHAVISDSQDRISTWTKENTSKEDL